MIRADGTPHAVFAGAVDDLDDGITHIISSEDLTNLTAVRIDIAAALPPGPAIARLHLPRPETAEGDRLSRRTGNFTLHALRQQGVEPTALSGYLACLGTRAEPRPGTPAELADQFGPENVTASFTDCFTGASAARFDMRRLLAVNRQALAMLPFAEVADRLPTGATEAFWQAVRGSLDLLAEARGYWDVVAGTIVPPVIEGEAEFLRAALDTLPAEPWDTEVWTTWTRALRRITGRAGKALTLPLRLALTGEDNGPALQALLPLIGRSRAAQRLAVAAS